MDIRGFISKAKERKAVEITINRKAEHTKVDYPVSRACQEPWQVRPVQADKNLAQKIFDHTRTP